MRLRVVFDKVIFQRQRFGGIGEYWRHLTTSLQCQSGIDCIWDTEVPFPLFIPNFSSNAVFHSSYYRYSMGFRTKTITTVHDFIHERGLVSAVSRSRAKTFAYLKQRAIANAAAIVCVSQSTAADLRHFYPRVASRVPVYVIHHGPTLDDRVDGIVSSSPSPNFPSDPFFLFVGRRRDAYKKFDLVLRGLAALSHREDRLKLLVVSDPFTPEEKVHIGSLGLSTTVECTGNIDNYALRSLYVNAVALIYPSSYEGFGLPVLDAMHLGCPVLAASIPVTREVAGHAAEYFDHGDVHSLAAALNRVLSPMHRIGMRERGFHQSRNFSWQKAAVEYLAVYRNAVNA